MDRQIFDKALSDLNKAIELDPKLVVAYRNRMVLYQKTGQKEKAETDANTIKTLEN